MMLFRAVFVLSAASLGYEILLMRLFSIVQWHHYAYMIISLALLGYGASGTFLALTQRWLLRRFAVVFPSSAMLFGLTAVGSFVVAQQVPFNPLEVLWEARQWGYLLLLYLLFWVPFFCAATCIALALAYRQDDIGRLYRADLLGAGGGALGIVAALVVLHPTMCLRLLAGLGFFAAALASLDRTLYRSRWLPLALLFGALMCPSVWPQDWLELRLSPYKSLSQALRVPEAEVIAERSSPLGLLTVVRSPTIPFRHAPGMSLNSTAEPPLQLGLFTDGEGLSVITQYTGHREPLAFVDFLTSALPYHLHTRPRVLVLGAGGGLEVLQAYYHHASRIDAVELNPQVIDLVRRTYAGFAGSLYDLDSVRVHVAEARSFVNASRETYDVIQVALLDAFGASAAGVHALNETYLYTVEALQAYVKHLRPGGVLAITRWFRLPPRDSVKLFATAVTALERSGVSHPGRRLALIRGWQTSTLLVKHGELTAADIAALRHFCDRRSFDLAYYPDMVAAEANRYNVLSRPYVYEAARALLGPERQDFMRRYKYHIAPATDDRPYFFHFFKWSVVPEILALRGQGSLPLLEWGYLILVAVLVQATVASVVLIVLPLRLVSSRSGPRWQRSRIGCYFAALGLAFLFIEIACMQRFVLFLGHPLYAIAVVLCGFLIFAGLGSGYAAGLTRRTRQAQHDRGGRPIALAVGGIVILALLYMMVLDTVFENALWLPAMAKVALSLALIAPLAFCMGLPFPLGLTRVARQMPGMIPWAWGINGCTSVLGTILAALLAVHVGFTAVLGLAVGLYGLAATVLYGPLRTE